MLDSIRIKTYSNLLLKTYRYGFVHIGRVGSVFLTLSVTVERFFAIVYPLKRIRRTRFLIYSSVIGAIAYNIPRFLEFKTNYIKIDEGNETFEVREKNGVIYHYPSYFICFLFSEKKLESLDTNKLDNLFRIQANNVYIRLHIKSFLNY